jgi:CheY-like chemotaxis protein
MPTMDGYQVLEALKQEDLNTFVIVVSADIQPLAQQRAKSLGAIAFVKKPVDTKVLQTVLNEYGILQC